MLKKKDGYPVYPLTQHSTFVLSFVFGHVFGSV